MTLCLPWQVCTYLDADSRRVSEQTWPRPVPSGSKYTDIAIVLVAQSDSIPKIGMLIHWDIFPPNVHISKGLWMIFLIILHIYVNPSNRQLGGHLHPLRGSGGLVLWVYLSAEPNSLLWLGMGLGLQITPNIYHYCLPLYDALSCVPMRSLDLYD